jgi:hypothetical protein
MSSETVKCDNIPLPISRIGLGTWAIGGWMWGGSNDAESINTVDTVGLGVRMVRQKYIERLSFAVKVGVFGKGESL